MPPIKYVIAISALATSLMLSATAQGVETSVNASNRGYYINTGEHFDTAYNTFTGFTDEGFGRSAFRSFFVFDITEPTGALSSAVLKLEVERYFGNGAIQNLRIVDVGTPINTLLVGHGLGSIEGQSIFADIGSGQEYGKFSVVASDQGSILTIPLNASAITALQTRGVGSFAIGIYNLGSSGSSVIPDGVRFSGLPPGILDEKNNPVPARLAQLVLSPVPEPSSLSMLAIGLAVISVQLLRKRLQ